MRSVHLKSYVGDRCTFMAVGVFSCFLFLSRRLFPKNDRTENYGMDCYPTPPHKRYRSIYASVDMVSTAVWAADFPKR